MSVFTDDDLKRLKDYSKNSPLKGLPMVDQELALIARLEAAEDLNFRLWAYHRNENAETLEAFSAALAKWRKAAGK